MSHCQCFCQNIQQYFAFTFCASADFKGYLTPILTATLSFTSTVLYAYVCVVCEAGQKVMVVGGGLTSAHVVSIALQQGASQVTWVMRKHLQV